MWAILAGVAFLAAQLYLLRNMKMADGFLSRQEEPEDREILSVAFADPDIAEQMARLLADFSRENPEIEMVLHTVPAVPEAVQEGRAALGFLPEGDGSAQGLSSCVIVLTGLSAQRIVWKTGLQSDCAAAFLRYLQQSGGNPA